MAIKQKHLTVRHTILDLRRRGYWDASRFPTVASFAALPKEERDQVVVTCRRRGFGFAVEVIPRSNLRNVAQQP